MKYTQMQIQRLKLGFSQEKAADQLGISRSYLSQLETYMLPAPVELVRKMTKLYQCAYKDLFPSTN